MNDAPAPPGSRAGVGRPHALSDDQARALARGIAQASRQVDAMIEQLGDIVSLVRGDLRDGATASAGPRTSERPGPDASRRSTRTDDRGRYDGDRRI